MRPPWLGKDSVTLLRVRAALLFLGIPVIACSVIACSNRPNAASAPDPTTVLETIAPPDPAQYERVQDVKKWRNPYLIIRPDGVALFDSADSAEIILKPEEVLPALARLPASNWPYGRIVAAAVTDVRTSEQQGIAIRRNKGIVGGVLEDAHVAIKWVPTS
jgi:hypothetical protein